MLSGERASQMRTIKLPIIVALVAECLLCAAFVLFGKFSFHGDSNLLGELIFFFHLPAMLLAERLFIPPPSHSGVYVPALAFTIFIGTIQFLIITLFGTSIYRRLRRSNVA